MKRRKYISSPAIIAIIVTVVIGTFFVLWLRPPEEIRAFSPDQRLSVQGQAVFADTAVDIELFSKNRGQPDLFMSPVYRLALRRSVSPLPFTVTYRMEDTAVMPPDLVFYQFRPSLQAWQVLLTDEQEGGVSTTLRLSGSDLLALGKPFAVDLPVVTPTILSELRAAPPPGAVGFRAFTAYAPQAFTDFILMNPVLDYGGCDGVFETGTSQTLTSKDVSVDQGYVRIGILWEIGLGCGVGEKVDSR